MREVIAVINQKGGVGKSTTAQAIGQGLTLKGYKVLFVDLDAQGNLTYSLNASQSNKTVLEVLTKQAVQMLQHHKKHKSLFLKHFRQPCKFHRKCL